jgi:hypothetical protein
MLTIASVLICLLLPPVNTKTPQIICTLGSGTSSNEYNAYADQRPTPDAMELARRVSAALISKCSPDCPALVIFRNPTAPNSILLADSDKVKMAYSPQFFTSVHERYGDGAIIAIIAHMLGHGMDAAAPARWMKNIPAPELRADAWAGCVLAEAGLSTSGLAAAFAALSRYPSPSHPGWSQRLPALRLGYTQCGGDVAKFPKGAGPK